MMTEAEKAGRLLPSGAERNKETMRRFLFSKR